MRLALVLLLAACTLPGCTLLGAGFAAEFNRQNRSDAQVDFDGRPPAPGDTLVLHLAEGRTARGAFVSASPDSVRLSSTALARADIRRAERPWRRHNVGRAALVGAGADLAFFGWLIYAFQDFSVPLDLNL
ncbi:MAG TPA: hypothetical protein VF594_01395 [Rubricoccaceae bacterium]|jgi:hypothetical protein